MRVKVILVLAAATAALLSVIYAESEAFARGGGGRGGHGGMMSGSRGPGSHGMHGMNRHMPRFAIKGQHSHGKNNMHNHAMGNHGKFDNMQGMWQKSSQRNNNFQGQWQVGGGGGGGSVGDICINAGACQGVWQVAPQPGSQTSQSRSLQRSWHVGNEM
ncbi:MAG: hypothetical protein WCB50_15575 [Pseudolabrys sp.]